MAAWLDALRKNSTRPLVERLQYLDNLKPRRNLTPDAVLAALEDYDFPCEPDVSRGIVRLVPEEHWLALLRGIQEHDDGHFFFEQLIVDLDIRLASVAGAALEGPDAPFALRLLASTYKESSRSSALDSAWPAIERRIVDPDFRTAYVATELVTDARRSAPALLSGLERVLAAASNDRGAFAFVDRDEDEEDDDDTPEDFISYDLQVLIENLLWSVAHAGTSLRALAPALKPLLHGDIPAWRSSALLAAIGIGADSLKADIESLPVSTAELSGPIDSMLRAYASWLFGGTEDDLTRALGFTEPGPIIQFRLEAALAVSPMGDRLLHALRKMSVNPEWTTSAYRTIAKLGAPAAKLLSETPELTQDHKEYLLDCEARWRCGLRSPADSRRAFESMFESDNHAWSCYVELALTDDVAFARLEKEVSVPAKKNPHPCGGQLFGATEAGARLLPLLLRGGYEEIVLHLHRVMPTDEFWLRAGVDRRG